MSPNLRKGQRRIGARAKDPILTISPDGSFAFPILRTTSLAVGLHFAIKLIVYFIYQH